MNFSARCCLVLLATSLVALRGFAAGLNWEVKEREVHTTAGSENVVMTFPFVNSGSGPIGITNVDTGCFCTTAKASKPVYAPGEHGQLTVEFALGERVGRQERLLLVKTDEPAAQPQELRLVVDIVELVTIRPRLLFWALDEAATAKTATITLARPPQTKLQPPTVSNPAFTARIDPTERPEIFLLTITPKDLSAPTNGVIRLETTTDGKPYALTVFTAVR